jgi:hypothetical protein
MSCARHPPDWSLPLPARPAPTAYTDPLDAWAPGSSVPRGGDDAYVFFRHDEVGRGPELALALIDALGELGR